jgi:hypothetical protein
LQIANELGKEIKIIEIWFDILRLTYIFW